MHLTTSSLLEKRRRIVFWDVSYERILSFRTYALPHTAESHLVAHLFSGHDSPTETSGRGRTRRARPSCLEHDTWTPNQNKVVLVENMYFMASMRGATGGEEIWPLPPCVSRVVNRPPRWDPGTQIKAMGNLGYTIFYAELLAELADLYRIVPDLVKIVIVADWDSFACYADKENCVQSEQNSSGIPIHKIFWPFPRHHLGQRWVLAPEPFALQPDPYLVSNNTYLGYSIEADCLLTPFPDRGTAWSKDDFDATTREAGVTFALGAGLSDDDPATAEYQKELERGLPAAPGEGGVYGSRRADGGLGRRGESAHAYSSPTLCNALCLGVPFIHPLERWDAANLDDTTQYHGQQ
ncbi:hypothetical protein C8R44DRAFT_879123 [Mycena epipterygia]|nr:hypothetical protein C8R44DRAFT_879123 [Mycena epipterygia]